MPRAAAAPAATIALSGFSVEVLEQRDRDARLLAASGRRAPTWPVASSPWSATSSVRRKPSSRASSPRRASEPGPKTRRVRNVKSNAVNASGVVAVSAKSWLRFAMYSTPFAGIGRRVDGAAHVHLGQQLLLLARLHAPPRRRPRRPGRPCRPPASASPRRPPACRAPRAPGPSSASSACRKPLKSDRYIDAVLDGRGRDRAADLVVVPDAPALGDVAALGRVDAVEVADALAVLRVLAVREVDEPFVHHGRADDLVARLGPDGVLRVGVELPQLLAGRRLVAAHPAVALAVDHLHHAADLADGRRGPLAVQDLVDDRVVLPDELPGLLVDRDDRGRARRRDVDVALVLPVRRADEDEVAPGHRARVREVVRRRADLVHHVEPPDHVGVGVGRQLLVRDGPVVLLVAEALGVEADELGAVADVVDAVALDERGAGDALVGPVVHASGRQLLVRDLPEELAVRLAERHHHAAVAGLLGIAQALVVRAHEHDPARHHRVAVGLRAESRHPLDALLRLHVPRRRQALGRGHHVARRPAAPHRPGRVAIRRHRPAGHRGQRDERQHPHRVPQVHRPSLPPRQLPGPAARCPIPRRAISHSCRSATACADSPCPPSYQRISFGSRAAA